MAEFNVLWEEKFKEFNDHVQKLESDLNVKHVNEMNELKKNLDENGKNIKFSKHFLDLKNQQVNLVKQQL